MKKIVINIDCADLLEALAKATKDKGGMTKGTYARMVLAERLVKDGYLKTEEAAR